MRSPLDVTPQVSVPTRSLQRLHRLQTSSRHLQRDVLTVLAWGSVATALGLWVADGGIQTVTSGAKVLVAGGIVTGLVATDLMVIMLILPPASRTSMPRSATTVRSHCTTSSASGCSSVCCSTRSS